MLKIRLILADTDSDYVKRMAAYLRKNYPEHVDVLEFTIQEEFENYAAGSPFDMALVDRSFLTDELLCSKSCIAVLAEKNGVLPNLNGLHAIAKYQKAPDFYKSILNVYSETRAEGDSSFLVDDQHTRVTVFTSATPGAGVSSCLLAAAIRLVQQGRKVFYLDLEDFSSVNAFFPVQGEGLSKAFYFIKSASSNLHYKIEALVHTDSSTGVSYLDAPQSMLDLYDSNMDGSDDFEKLLSVLAASSTYDEILVDMPLRFTEPYLKLLDLCRQIVLVGKYGKLSYQKLQGALGALKILEPRRGQSYLSKILFLTNKSASECPMEEVRSCGAIGAVHGETPVEVAIQLSYAAPVGKIADAILSAEGG